MPQSNPSQASAKRRPVLFSLVGAGLVAAMALGGFVARAADPDALWKIVHGRCVPHAAAGDPAPCREVDADDAVLKDIVGATQFLLIPTARITGIESPALLAPGAPNFFADAWRARRYTSQAAGHDLPPEDIALAINPPSARSQEQLHIHVDCIRPDIRDALHTMTIGDHWARLPAGLAGQRYSARRIAGDTLPNPFDLLADDLPGARDAMGLYTLVVTGTGGVSDAPGFILLAGRVGPDGLGHGEDLQDHGCAVATSPK